MKLVVWVARVFGKVAHVHVKRRYIQIIQLVKEAYRYCTLYDAAQFEHDNNKKDENESVVAQSQKVTFIQNQNQKFHHLRAQESSQFLSSLLLNTLLLLSKKSPDLEEARV